MNKLLIIGGSGLFGKSFIDCGVRKKLIKHRINKIYIISRKKKKIKKTPSPQKDKNDVSAGPFSDDDQEALNVTNESKRRAFSVKYDAFKLKRKKNFALNT